MYLTPRELEVVRLLAAGLDAGQIAKRLQIERCTVYTHLSQAQQKCNCRTALELATKIARGDLVIASGATSAK